MFRQLIFSAALLGITTLSHAELVVIAHPGSTVHSISVAQLSRLFLGQSTSYSDGSRAVPLDVSGDTRNQFYSSILKRQPEQVEKYWARMIFTGKAQPPREVRLGDIKSTVAETPGAISYIDSSKVDSSVKVLRVEGDR
jgi:ABC-type phosphate transport system substrate-binding protein